MLFATARVLMRYEGPLMKRAIKNYLAEEKPDLVISVVPLVNNLIKDSCDELDIPFLLIPTDFDIKTFVSNITMPIPGSMRLALPFENKGTLLSLQAIDFPSAQVNYIDFPLRASFFEEKDLHSIKKLFQVPSGKKVLLVLMGAAGSNAILRYIKTLVRLDLPLHLLVCIGRNKTVKKDLQVISLPANISITIIGQTDKIADLMAIADVCITKAGSVSVAETLYSNIPMILDNTSTPLRWEAYNLNFIKDQGFGRVCNDLHQLNHLVREILTNESYFDYLKTNLQDFPKESFGSKLQRVVKKLIG